VASSLSYEEMRAPVGLFVPMNERVSSLLQKNMQHQQSALQAGFYGDWNPGNHEDYLSNRFPENFSLLADDPNDHVTHGHHGSGIYVVTSEGYGFAKNDFIDDTNGAESFAVTLRKMTQVASIIGGSEEEKQRIILGFYTDTLQVGSGIVMPGMPVFTEAA
jgi:hypothetical protein